MINGSKIMLRGLESQDIEQLRQWRNLPSLRRYFREYREITKEMQQEWFSNVTTKSTEFHFTINDKKKQKIIGHCALSYVNWVSRTAEFAIYIGDMEYRGKGFGSDALRQLCRYGFEYLNLNRIWCEVYSNNASLDMYRHIGFKDEGMLRENYYSEGKYWDSHILSMLKRDYDSREQ